MKCIDASEIYQLTIGIIDDDRMAALEHHFSHCKKCASTREEVRNIAARLAPSDNEFVDNELANRVMSLIHLGRMPQKVPRASWWARLQIQWPRCVVAPLVAAATVFLIFFIWPKASLFYSPPFQARGVLENPDQWVSIHAYRSGINNSYHPVSSFVTPDDELAFSYSNRTKGHFGYLMILAVDSSGRIFWYYPAYIREQQNPTSIPISTSDKSLTLPEKVRHEFKLGALRIFGIFSETPLDVHTVESTIASDLTAIGSIEKLSRLHLSKTGQHSLLLQVKLSAK